MKYLLILLLIFGQKAYSQTFTLVDDIIGVTTDIHFDKFGDRYITKKNGVLLKNDDTLWTYNVRTASELGLLAITVFKDKVCVYLSGNDSLNHLICDFDTILSINYRDPYTNRHVGGDLVVQDDILYLSTGYGVDLSSAQDTNSDLGKILAIQDSSYWIHTRGLRNPFRFDIAFDTFYIPDVGKDSLEELNVVSEEGLNLGWNCAEGSWVTDTTCGELTFPEYEYSNNGDPQCIIGLGYYGDGYFFTDLYTGLGGIFSAGGVLPLTTPIDIVSGAVNYITGEFFVLALDGKIYRYDDVVLGIDSIPSKHPPIPWIDHDWEEYLDSINGNIFWGIDGKFYIELPKYTGFYFDYRHNIWIFVR